MPDLTGLNAFGVLALLGGLWAVLWGTGWLLERLVDGLSVGTSLNHIVED